MGLSRRDLLKLSGAAAAAIGAAGCSQMGLGPDEEETTNAGSVGVGTEAALPKTDAPRVVVVGGGWSGLTVAKYVKKYAPNADVVLVEQRGEFMSCPVSNLWLVEAVELDFLIHDYLQAARENNYTFFNATVVGVDKAKRTVMTSDGDLTYDYLVLAPGIDYDYSEWTKEPALERRLRTEFPAGFKPGSEHLTLRNKVLDFEGGNFILTVPGGNYRCLPAPYERACLIADYFKKEGIEGKVVLIDENDDITIKAEGFHSAFDKLYKEYIDYHPGTKIAHFDLDKKEVMTDYDDVIAFEDAAFYPHVRGGKILEVAGVAKDSIFNKMEADINVLTYEVNGHPEIYCGGDVRPMGFSKSGNTANTEGVYIAKRIAAKINGGEETPWESPLTICYSAVASDPVLAISINAGYAYDAKAKRFTFANVYTNETWDGRVGINNGRGLMEWAKGMYRDMFNA
ncbi:NAD(P)/FAD-dependent oxidoreductase [Sulfurimonas sp. HSL-3221]|uniref:FAD-dependent oxidoreductase n=1 Tax=Sulfurimonadaceae TaxID=2771471 RepID=UPI001E330876|nr:FAD/NAD(P)-binding oxidoreductase [Sulfurimonas sp. HSL-3221]UFS62176.1 NAD(P)/FAD-dependent oxidoreductase [Sulfurimonas sp. HSL-3221]